jgi:putative membrane protein
LILSNSGLFQLFLVKYGLLKGGAEIMMHYGFWGYPGMGWLGWGGLIFPLIFWAALIFLFVALFRGSRRHEETEDNTALDILKQRYAKGEITKKDFEEMKKDIA